MLEHHSHTAAVDIDINLWVCDIDTIEDDLSACWIFHTVQAAQKCTLTGAGRTDDNHNVALVHSDVDAFQDFIVTKMFSRSMTSITLSQAPFHHFNSKADQQDKHDVDDCHNQIWNHELVAVTSDVVECHIQI